VCDEHAAVRKAGKFVVLREIANAGRLALALGNISENDAIVESVGPLPA